MSLVKSPRLTEKRRAALRRNSELSSGPKTAAGLARIRQAHWRHGLYSQEEGDALLVLGEDPAAFEELREGLCWKWNPTDILEEQLIARLARAVWLADRADRMQEGQTLRQARQVNRSREGRLHANLMRLKMTSESLRMLAAAVSRKHYVTQPTDLDLMLNLLRDGATTDLGEIALALFYQLEPPGAGKPHVMTPEEREAEVRAAVVRFRAVFGLYPKPANSPAQGGVAPHPANASAPAGENAAAVQGSVAPEAGPPAVPAPSEEPAGNESQYPAITEAEWAAREPVRHLLEHILKRLARACQAERQAILQEGLKGPSRYERAAEIAPVETRGLGMHRLEDFGFRQIWRITNLLMKMKRQDLELERHAEPRLYPAPAAGKGRGRS